MFRDRRYTATAWSVDKVIRPLRFWALGALSWADINKLDLLTNIPWIAALEEQEEANLHLVLRKTPLTPII